MTPLATISGKAATPAFRSLDEEIPAIEANVPRGQDERRLSTLRSKWAGYLRPHRWLGPGPVPERRLQGSQVEAAVGVEDLAGAVVQQAVGDGADATGDVGGLAHAALGQ